MLTSPQYSIGLRLVLVCVGFTLSLATTAKAQMANNPWGFKSQNRASVAALIRQVESEDNIAGTTQASQNNLVCGSDGKSSASGNSTCVILNNSTGHIEIGQDSDGSQTVTSTNDEVAPVETPAGAEDVLATLNASPGR